MSLCNSSRAYEGKSGGYLAHWGSKADIIQAFASVAAVGLSIPALLLGLDNRNRTQSDQLEIQQPTLGLYDPALGWQAHRRWTEKNAPITITDDQWLASTPTGRHFSVRLYNAGLQEIYLNHFGLVTQEDDDTSTYINVPTMEQGCGPDFDRLGQCPDTLSPNEAMIVQFTLSSDYLSSLAESFRHEPITITVEIGSGFRNYSSHISLPSVAFS
jgi:hypothetical protein